MTDDNIKNEKKLPLNDERIPCHSCQGKKRGENGGWYCDFVDDDNMCEPPVFPLYKETLEEHDKHCEMCRVAKQVAEEKILKVAEGPKQKLEQKEEETGKENVVDLCKKAEDAKEAFHKRVQEIADASAPPTPAESPDPERIAIEKEEAMNKFAYIVKRAKKLDKRGKPKQCGTHRLILDIDGQDLPVYVIMAIRKEQGKIVAAEPLAIIVNQALKMKLRPESVSKEDYKKSLKEQLAAVQAAKSPGVLPREKAGPQQGGGITAGEVKTDE